jgi:hypothetical protein
MIWGGSFKKIFMTDQNSAIDHQIRPEQLQDELGIKKDAYYAYLKHLGFKARRGADGKSYLEPEQANLVRAIRQHVVDGGKIEDFVVSDHEPGGSLAVAENGDLAGEMPQGGQQQPEQEPAEGFDMDALMREAAKLAAHRMAYADEVKLQLASQMTYDDLPDDIKAEVDAVRQAAMPSEQPGKIAAELLSRWRQRRQGQNQVQAA